LYRARKLKRSGEFELEKTLINQDSPRRCGKTIAAVKLGDDLLVHHLDP
jgi:hypothetical protein